MSHVSSFKALVVCLVAGMAGCGDGAPADVSGRYLLALTVARNGCAMNNWMEGEMLQGLELLVTQDPKDRSKMTGSVEGIGGGFVALWLGTNVFTGTVSGSSINMEIRGTRTMSDRSCAFTTNAQARAFVDRSTGVIMGSVRYTYATNNSPDCGTRVSCETLQNFNGTRPPPPSR